MNLERIVRDEEGTKILSCSPNGKPLELLYSLQAFHKNSNAYLSHQYMQHYWAVRGEEKNLKALQEEHAASVNDLLEVQHTLETGDGFSKEVVRFGHRFLLGFGTFVSFGTFLKGYLERDMELASKEILLYEQLQSAAKEGETLFKEFEISDSILNVVRDKCAVLAQELSSIFQQNIYVAKNRRSLREEQLAVFYPRQK